MSRAVVTFFCPWQEEPWRCHFTLGATGRSQSSSHFTLASCSLTAARGTGAQPPQTRTRGRKPKKLHRPRRLHLTRGRVLTQPQHTQAAAVAHSTVRRGVVIRQPACELAPLQTVEQCQLNWRAPMRAIRCMYMCVLGMYGMYVKFARFRKFRNTLYRTPFTN